MKLPVKPNIILPRIVLLEEHCRLGASGAGRNRRAVRSHSAWSRFTRGEAARRLHLAGQVDGRRTGPPRRGKYGGTPERSPSGKIAGRPEVGLRLAGETDDHVDADERIGHPPAYGGDPIGEARRRIASAHQAENPVRTALQRNMEMMWNLVDEAQKSMISSVSKLGSIDEIDSVRSPSTASSARRRSMNRFAGRPAEIAGIDAP